MTNHAQTAIEDALAAGEPQKRQLPFILAGPIVRRAEPDGVWFWFACSAEITGCTPQITVYDSKGVINDTLANQKGWMPLGKPELRVARLGERLWIALVKAQPLSRPFTRAWFYGYELTIQSPNFSTKVSDQNLGLAYPPFKLPTFMLANDDGQRLMHGSCRRPGATGGDAYPAFDAWLKVPQSNPLLPGRTYTPISDLSRRPAGLILTGDQIYADDVAVPLFKAVQRLARDVFGYVERIPTVDGRGTVSVDEFLPPPRAGAPPPTGAVATRKTLTSLGKSPMGFTTDDGEAHLLSFPEFAAMYLLVMNDRLCRDYGVDDGTDPQLKGFPAAVAASRRVQANMVTYMVFDDHEITDDWNLDEAWVKATTNPMARRVIANGLAAYWAFQGWGNDPSQFEPLKGAITAHLDGMRAARGTPAAQAAAFDRNLYAQHWSFVAPTTPPALCVDTRTSRAFPPGEKAVLSGPNVWPHLRRLAQRHRLRKGAPLLLVLPTPLLDNRIMAKGQSKKYTWPGQRYQGDYELYINNPKQRADLIRELRNQLDPPNIVIFSGDVHHGFLVSGLYVGAPTREAIDTAKGTWGIRVNQVTSSPIKNIHTAAFVEKWKGITDPGNLGEEFVPLYQTLYDDTQKPVVGVRADVVRLKGNLGRETFVWENHLCVVDIPEVLGGDVKVLFVGNKDGTVKTATASATTKNDPKLFQPSPATIMKRQPPVFMPMEEDAPEPVALAAVGGPPGLYERTAIEHALGISRAASGTAVMPVPSAPAAPAAPSRRPAAAGEADVASVPLLVEHHDTPPDMILRWNDLADHSGGIDVVVHLHGFSSDRRLDLRRRKLPVSGLDFTPPAATAGMPSQSAWTGRRRPTLLVLPRGRARPEDAAAYDFPALVRPGAFAQLIDAALRELEAHAGISRRLEPRRIILTAHSGAGAPLNRILDRTEGTPVDPHEVHVFDALYGDAAGLRGWVARRLRRDVDRLRAGVPDPASYMAAEGSALRTLYLHGSERATTRPSSLAVQATADGIIPAGTPHTALLKRHYRTEVARVGHTTVPYWYGGRLLADVTADVPGP